MEVSIEKLDGLERQMKIQIPAERIDDEVNSRLQSMVKTIRMDGFRPGKIPLKVIRQKFGKQVRQEVIDRIVSTSLQDAMTQENVKPAGEPVVQSTVPESGQALEFTAIYEIFPELDGDVEYGFKVKKPAAEITDSDVSTMLKNLQKQRATWKKVDRTAEADDQLVIDFEGTVGGESFTGNAAENVTLILGSGTMVPGFEDQLIGTSAGDEVTVKVTFPESYPSTEVAGKDARFKVKVHTVSEIVLSELNDDFATAFGIEGNGLEGLKKEVTENMQRELKQFISSSLKIQVFDGLLEKNPVEVPQNLIESEIEQLKEQAAKTSALLLDEVALRADAERRVKLGVLVSEVIKQNQLQPDPDRVREAIESIAASYEKPEEVIQHYYGNQEMLSGIQSAIIEDQVVDWVIENENIDLEDEATTFEKLVEAAKQA